MENCLPGSEMDNLRTNKRMQRRTTDSTAKCIFWIFTVGWIALLLVGIFWKSTMYFPAVSSDAPKETPEIIEKLKSDWIPISLKVVLGLLLSIVGIFLTKRCAGVFCRWTIICYYILPFLIVFSLIFTPQRITPQSIISNIILMVICITLMLGMKRLNRDAVQKVVKDTCRVIHFYPQSIILAIVSAAVMLVIMVLCFYIFHIIFLWMGYYRTPGYYIAGILLIYFNFLTGYWMTLVIWNVLELFTSTACILWYSAENKDTLSAADIRSQTFSVIRSHFGTVCFGSVPLVGYIVKIAMIFKSEAVSLDNYKENPVMAICIFILYVSFPDNSLYNMMIIYGTDFANSAKKLLELMVKNPWSYFAWKLIALGALSVSLIVPIVVITTIQITQIFNDLDISQNHQLPAIAVIFLPFILSMSGIFLMMIVLNCAANAIHICAVQDDTQNVGKSNNFRVLTRNP